MKGKSFGVLAAGAVVVIAGVVFVEGRYEAGRGGGVAEVKGAGELYLPALQERGNDITQVTVLRDGQTTTVRRGDTGWELAEKGGYPAKPDQVRNLIVALSQLIAAEPMTARPENYSKLGVQDPPTEAAELGGAGGAEVGTMGPALITLKDANDQTITSVIVGSPKWGAKPGVYVRKAGEAQSWLAEGQVEVPSGLAAWAETKILDIVRDRVKSASTHHPDGEVVTVSRAAPDATNFIVENAPSGKELKSAGVGDPLGAALAYVSVEDVAPVTGIDFTGKDGGKPGALCQFQTFDGLSITVQTVEKDSKTWAQFAVAFDAALALPTPPAGSSIKAADEARKEADELATKLSPWAFQLPSYKVVPLNTRMAELLKETPPAVPASMDGVQMIDPAQLVQPPAVPATAPQPQPAPPAPPAAPPAEPATPAPGL